MWKSSIKWTRCIIGSFRSASSVFVKICGSMLNTRATSAFSWGGIMAWRANRNASIRERLAKLEQNASLWPFPSTSFTKEKQQQQSVKEKLPALSGLAKDKELVISQNNYHPIPPLLHKSRQTREANSRKCPGWVSNPWYVVSCQRNENLSQSLCHSTSRSWRRSQCQLNVKQKFFPLSEKPAASRICLSLLGQWQHHSIRMI